MEEDFGAVEVSDLHEQEGQVGRGHGRPRMLVAEDVAIDREGFPVEGLGPRGVSLAFQQSAEIEQTLGELGMLVAEQLAAQRQRLAKR